MEKHFEPGCYWIRFWKNGAGINIRDRLRFPLLFSEREGFTRYLGLGKWTVKWLKPIPVLSAAEEIAIAAEQQMQLEDWQENDPSDDFLVAPEINPGPFAGGHYHYANDRVTRVPDFEGIDSVCFCPAGEWLERDANGYVIKELNVKSCEDLKTQKAELPLFALDARRKLRVE